MNIASYIVYIAITFVITIYVGRICYNNGAYYIIELIPDNLSLAHTINKLLLICYYLLNLGYVLLMIIAWKKIVSYQMMIDEITLMISRIFFTLAIMHYINMFVIWIISKSDSTIIHPKIIKND